MVPFVALAAMSFAVGFAPAETGASTTTAAVAPAADANKKVCRRQVSTGSIMGKAVCRTRAEWAAISAKDEADTDQMRHRSRAVERSGAGSQ